MMTPTMTPLSGPRIEASEWTWRATWYPRPAQNATTSSRSTSTTPLGARFLTVMTSLRALPSGRSRRAHQSTEARCLADSMLGGQDLVEDRLGLVFVRAFGQRELAHQDLPGLGEHPLLAGRQPALTIATPKITHNLRDLVHVTRGQLFEVGLVATRPVGRLFGVRRAEHLEHLVEALLTHHVSNAYKLGIVGGYPNREIALGDLQDKVNALLAIDDTTLDGFDQCSPVMGVDDRLADVERHVQEPLPLTQEYHAEEARGNGRVRICAGQSHAGAESKITNNRSGS